MPIFIKSGLHLLHNGPVLLSVKFDGGIRGAAGDIILAIAAAQKTPAVVETLISYFLISSLLSKLRIQNMAWVTEPLFLPSIKSGLIGWKST